MTPKKDANVLDTIQFQADETVDQNSINDDIPPWKIVWPNIILHSGLHLGGVYGLYRLFYCQYQTILLVIFLYFINALGITAGAHRLWAHKSYKAKLPLKIILMIFNCVAMQVEVDSISTTCAQAIKSSSRIALYLWKDNAVLFPNMITDQNDSTKNDIIEWARDHRVHHKFSETNADPHNAKRGFFFAHVGWLLVRKHPDVIRKGKTLDMSDLHNEKVLLFQKRYYKLLVLLFCFILPTTIPTLWGENKINALFTCCLLRCCLTLNATWLVNSAAHLWGSKPYDKTINPAQNILVSTSTIGEGFHNYHHTFPQDYKASEFSWYFNQTTLFIDFMAWLGWAYDRKTISNQIILERKQKTGDGAH